MADKNMEAQISVEFEEATSRQSLNSGETINTLWGKVKRWFTDLKTVAFSGSYSDLSNKPTISNPNLLINPDFRINQRVASGTIAPNKNADGEDIHTYFVDRWGIDSGSVSINSDGTLTLNGTISQILENTVGINVTASVSAGMASYDDSTKRCNNFMV